MQVRLFVNVEKQWGLSGFDGEIGQVPDMSNPASVLITNLLSPPLVYVLVGLVFICIFICLITVFKEEMKPCLYGMLDGLAFVGMICFRVTSYVWSWVKYFSYHVKESIFSLTDQETCFCCGARCKNFFHTGDTLHQVHRRTPGGGAALPQFQASYKTNLERRAEESAVFSHRKDLERQERLQETKVAEKAAGNRVDPTNDNALVHIADEAQEVTAELRENLEKTMMLAMPSFTSRPGNGDTGAGI